MSSAIPNRLIHLTTTDISLELLLGPQLSAFQAAGYEVIAMSAPGPFLEQIEARGIEHVPLENATRSMNLRSDAAALFELRSLFKRLRPEIVHTHNPKPGVYGRIAARLARVPHVVNTVHGLYALPEDPLPKRAVVYSLERLASSCSDAELIQNPEDIPTLRSLRIPASKLTLLGNGVDLSRFDASDREKWSESARASLGVTPDSLVVGAIGRLVEEKGYPELFEAWNLIRERFPEARLVIIGPQEPDKADGVDTEMIRAAEASGVIFTGMRDDVEHLYHALDIYVLASHREGFPRSAMEAAACGLPIVATDIRGCRQVVDDGVTGILVPLRSPAGLAEAIGKLLASPSMRSTMSTAAVERSLANFDQERVIDQTLRTYRRLKAHG